MRAAILGPRSTLPRQRKGILFPGQPRKRTPGSPFLTPGYSLLKAA